LMRGEARIESSFHESLVENLNAEISLTSIHSVDEAVVWLKSTFFFQRFVRDPQKYGFSIETPGDPLTIDRELQKLCRNSVKSLAGIECVLLNDRLDVSPTPIGKLMAKYCIAFETMKMIYELKGEESMSDLLMLLSKSAEFSDVALRQSEKSILNRLSEKKNPDRIRYPLESKVKTNYHKVFVIIQAALGGTSFSDISLTQESLLIFKSAPRIAICLMEFLLNKRRDYKLCIQGVYLAKSIKARLWEHSKLTMKQLKGIGDKMAQVLVDAGYSDLASVRSADPRRLEMALNRAPPFGSYLIQKVERLPLYSLSVETVNPVRETTARLRVIITLTNKDQMTPETATIGRFHHCVLLVGDEDNNVVYLRRVYDSELMQKGRVQYEFKVDRAKTSPELQIHYLSTEFVGLDIWIARKPVYSDLHSCSDDANGSAGVNEKQQNELNQDGQGKPSNTPSSRSVSRAKGPCGHHCVNKRTCKHDCCKVKDSISSKQLPISRFLKKKVNKEVEALNEGEKEDGGGEKRLTTPSSTTAKSAIEKSISNSSIFDDERSESEAQPSISQKLSEKMSRFQFRPLQKVPPMIRGVENPRTSICHGAANRFPQAEPQVASNSVDDEGLRSRNRTTQSTFNHLTANARQNESSVSTALSISNVEGAKSRDEQTSAYDVASGLTEGRYRSSEDQFVESTAQTHDDHWKSAKEKNDTHTAKRLPIPSVEPVQPIRPAEILNPSFGLKRRSSAVLPSRRDDCLKRRPEPSLQSVISWATSPIEEEIKSLKKDLSELQRFRKEMSERGVDPMKQISPPPPRSPSPFESFNTSGHVSTENAPLPRKKIDYISLLNDLDEF